MAALSVAIKEAEVQKGCVAETPSIKMEPGRKKAHEDDEEDEEGELNDVDYGKGENEHPTDDSLRLWVRAYLRCFNLEKATVKHAVETASDKFGMNLIDRKDRIKELIAEEM